MSADEDKGCGQEGHVCVCSEQAETKVPEMSGTVEDWILQELGATEERVALGKEMFDQTYGIVLAIHMCIMWVKIGSKHDEIAAAYKKAVAALSGVAGKRGRKRSSVHFLMHVGLAVFRKLNLDKVGKTIADDNWNEYWMDLNCNEDKMRAALKAAYGE